MKKVIVSILIVIGSVIVSTLSSCVIAKTQEKDVENFANVVLFAEFKDNKGCFEQSENREKILEYYNGSSKRSFTNYMDAISYGQFKVHNIFPQDDGNKITPYILPYSVEEAKNGDIDYNIIKELITNIPGISNKVIDYNNDGMIDNLTVILYGEGSNSSITPTIYPHKSNYDGLEKWSNKSVYCYNILNTGRLLATTLPEKGSLIAHEFMHTLGYPDLYTTDSTNPVGPWDIMASTSMFIQYPLAYTRSYFSNWISIDTITKSQTLTLNSQDNPNGNQAFILKSPLNEHEIFVIEYRKKTNPFDVESYDSKIGGSGIIVYRVDLTVEKLSNHKGKTGIYVFRPQTGYDNEALALNNAFLSKESGRTSIGTKNQDAILKDGALTFTDGTNSGIVISDVASSSGNSITCKVTIPEKSEFDLWENTNFPNSSISQEDTNKNITMTVGNSKQYVISYENGKYQGYEYDGTIWKEFGSSFAASEGSEIKLVMHKNELYFAYTEYTNTSCHIIVKKYNGTSWINVGQFNDSYNFDLISNEDTLYLVHDINFATARLEKLTNSSFTTVGNYFEESCGQPKITELKGKVYVSVRKAADNQIKIYKVDGNTFTEISNTYIKANTYDMKSNGDNLYILLGGNNITLHSFNGTNWTLGNPNTQISAFEPHLNIVQGKVYALISPQTGEGQIKVYGYEGENNWKQEGTNVDSTSDNLTLTSYNNNLYISYCRNIDNKLIVKVKKTSIENKLLSITVVPPTKVVYTKGEILNNTGLKVTANYTLGTQLLKNSDYTISNWNTNAVGNKTATVMYQGLSSTFEYKVKEKENTLLSITVVPPTKVVYTKGEIVNNIGLKVTANYTLGNQVLGSNEYEISNWNTNIVGTRTAKVTYQGLSSTFNYQVKEKEIPPPVVTLMSIMVTSPSKTSYIIGENLNTTGLTITANYSNNIKKSVNIKDCAITGFNSSSEGTIKVKVEYQGKIAYFNVKITAKTPNVIYATHVQNEGWQNSKINGQISGTTGKSLRLEGIKVFISNSSYSGGISYSTHIQNIGWQNFVANNSLSGTTGQSLRLEAIKIKLTGEMAKHYDIYYRVHAQDFGWLDWAKNGNAAGTAGYSYRLEGIQIKIVKKGDKAPGSILKSYIQKYVLYTTHVQNVGWQEKSFDGQIAGTSGKSLRLEAIQIELSNKLYSGDIRYKTHVQNVGWQGWRKNGEISGTSGKSLRLEAIQIELTGEMTKHYDVYYRVHVQNVGWQEWKKNGQMAGTSGKSLRLEGIEIKLVAK